MYHIILKESDLIHENHFPAIALINEAFHTDPLEFIHNLSLGIGSGYNYASCSFWDELDDFDKANIPRFHGLRIVTEGNEELVISMSELIFYLETACNTLANAGVKDAPKMKKAIETLKAAN